MKVLGASEGGVVPGVLPTKRILGRATIIPPCLVVQGLFWFYIPFLHFRENVRVCAYTRMHTRVLTPLTPLNSGDRRKP